MSVYDRMLIEVTGCNQADIAQIEDVMHSQYKTLDGLDRATFDRLARLSWVAVRELRVEGVLAIPAGGD